MFFYGDVLLCNDMHHIVEYDDTGAFVVFDGDETHYFFEPFGFEVIGNVFDNPDLAENFEEHNRKVLNNSQFK